MAHDVDTKKKAAKDEGGILETIKVVVQPSAGASTPSAVAKTDALPQGAR